MPTSIRPDVARYLRWDARDRAQVRQALAHQCEETALRAEGDWLTFAEVWREASKVVEEAGLKLISWANRQGEIGFVFNPDYHGRGLATEAAESLLMLGFGTIGLHRIIGSCDPRNRPSARLMERIGMRPEARFMHSEIVKGQWADELVYAILDHEWRARSPPVGLSVSGNWARLLSVRQTVGTLSAALGYIAPGAPERPAEALTPVLAVYLLRFEGLRPARADRGADWQWDGRRAKCRR